MPKNTKTIGLYESLLAIGLLYIFSFIIDALLISRTTIPSSTVKFASSAGLCIIFSIIFFHTEFSIQQIKHSKNNRLATLFVLATIKIAFGITWPVLALSLEHSNLPELCHSTTPSAYRWAQSVVLAPVIETLVFVVLIPRLFIERYKNKGLLTGVLISSTVFATLHSGGSSELIISRLCTGIIYCYMYLSLNSILSVLLTHATFNAMLLYMEASTNGFCMRIMQIAQTLSIPLVFIGFCTTLAVIVIFCRYTRVEGDSIIYAHN